MNTAAQANPLLAVDRLEAWYGKAQILFGASLSVGRGEVVALMGRNGAGKSTTMKAIMGLVPRRQGRIAFQGEDISRLAPHDIARRGLGWVPEDRRIFTDLTVEENLEVGRHPPRPGAPSFTPQSLKALFPNLADMPGRLGGRMSGGEQQMLTIARTLMGNPHVVLLDEPSEGVAPVIVDQLARTIAALKRDGLSVLLSEQNVGFAQRVCDRAYLLDRGQVVFEGSMQALLDDAALRREHLGL